jgi:murein DD-endopeptidase MepM/ murein hydrolase activator NlpD
MSPRISHSESRSPRRFCLTFAFGKGSRSISLPPLLFYIAVGVIPILCLWYLFATLYLIFRDDMLASLMNHQTEMQYAYEDRLTALHAQIDQLTSRKLLDEAALSTKMDSIASRQIRLERRNAVVASLAERVLPKSEQKAAAIQAALPSMQSDVRSKLTPTHPPANPLLSGAFSSKTLPPEVSAFAPAEMTPAQSAPRKPAETAKPRPDGFDLRHNQDTDFVPEAASGKSSDLRDPGDGSVALALVTSSLDQIEGTQNHLVAGLQTPLMGEIARSRTILSEAGVSPARLALRGQQTSGSKSQEAVGGPFVPLQLESDGSAFEREAVSLQDTIIAVEQMRRAISSVPLRKPLAGDPDITSGFGARLDPFFGRAAMHTGIDLREDYGTDVHATAAGKVTIAGPDGGYGNLVELDHGNGLSTRYAHMSVILVSEGQMIQAGQVVGRIGMTGRTTGPHLHYETRIDGEPVDPLRFLRAGARLFSQSENATRVD